MRVLAIICFSLFMIGCSHTYELRRSNTNVEKLKVSSSVYVALPEDGRFHQTVYHGSGKMLADEIIIAFSIYFKNIVIGEKIENFEQALNTASINEYSYLIYPRIIHWEDRATEWSGRRDKIIVEITLANVDTGETLDKVILKGTSRWFTFGGDHPQELLAEPLKNYASSLF